MSTIQQFMSKEDMGADLLIYREMMEHNEISNDVVSLNCDIEELDRLQHAHTEVTAIQTALQKAVDTGMGVSPVAVKIAQTAIESISLRVNITDSNLFPALENFNNSKTRLAATNVSLENIADRVIKFAKALIELIERMWVKVKAVLRKIFNRHDSVKKSLKEAMKEAEDLPDNSVRSSVGNENHTDTAWRPLAINGKTNFDTAITIVKDTDILVKGTNDVVGSIIECLNAVSRKNDSESIEREVFKLTNEVKNKVGHLTLINKKFTDNEIVYKYAYLIDQQACILHEYISKTHSDQDPKIFNVSVEYGKLDKEYPYHRPELLTKSQMATIGHLAADLADTAKELDDIYPSIEKALNFEIKRLKSLGDHLGRFSDKENLTMLYLSKDLFSYVTSNLPKLGSTGLQTAVYVSYYIKSCVQRYKRGDLDA